MSELPDKIKRLQVTIGSNAVGELLRESRYLFKYDTDDESQPAVSILMPPKTSVYEDGDLFPSMDMNLPEGFLFQHILEMFPKRQLTKMHLLALMGNNAIGRVGFSLPDQASKWPVAAAIDRKQILRMPVTDKTFGDLVQAYLSTGIGISGVQPKIMVPSRASLTVPDLIVKASGPAYPGLAVNEWLCLRAADEAGIRVPRFELSDDGQLLVLDRFDIAPDGTRLGFEDIAALMTLRVHDRLSSRKYQGSYENIARVVSLMSASPAQDLAAFFDQVAFSVMVRNGDAHLKNFGMLYTNDADARLSPMFDVVTTAIYKYERPGGVESEDRTLALKWRAGKRWANGGYPTTDQLLDFGRAVCYVSRPQEAIARIADAMSSTLEEAGQNDRVGELLLEQISGQWATGMEHAGRRA
jgi:serine/threonine-protein kinase HipA